MAAPSAILAPKELAEEKKKPERELLPFLPFLTFFPIGNPLERMSAFQRQFFLESIFRTLHTQRMEDRARTGALFGGKAASASAFMAGIAAMRSGAELQKEMASQLMVEKRAGKEDGAGGAGAGGAAGGGQKVVSPHSLVFGAMSAEATAAAERLAQVLGDYARGDEARAKAAMAEFESRLKAQNYGQGDLMAVLLLVIEDEIWAGEEGGIGGARPFGGGVRASSIPGKLRESAKDSAEARLASVREMLRYYFDRHPGEYGPALAAALGITSDQEEDMQFLQERLAFELASIGSFALSQMMLAKIKEQRKMGTKKCLLELGYVYDGKKKKLVLGKRTCGNPVEARGVIGLLMGSLRGKAK